MGDHWADIPPAGGPEADNVRRVDATHPMDLFRGRDFAGRLLLTLTAEISGGPLPELPRLAGIDVQLESGTTARARLVLRLHDIGHADIFKALCEHLIGATRSLPTGDNEAGLRLVVRRLRHWHEMLRRRRDEILNRQEQVGLTGELLFLRDRVLPVLPAHQAILAWRGARREEQDFALGRWQIEVKTQLSTADQRLLISSEAQLEAAADFLLLCHQRIAGAPPSGTGAATLNGLVEGIRLAIAGAGDGPADAFEEALAEWGYSTRPEYGDDWWLLVARDLYEVREGFPRLTPGMLPEGVQNVRYEVNLQDCQSFRVDLDAVLAEVFV